MSRLTASEVIAQGRYLEPEFQPSTLTVSQLLGILSFHDVSYPTPYSKPKLVQVFNDEIKPYASRYKRERVKKENSIASDDGITDGITGEPVGKGKAPVKRSSRRLSRPPDEEQEPPRADPPKRRRSAEPSLGGARRSKIIPNQPVLLEESEPEEEESPIRKVGRSKKTAQAAGAQSRRVSHAEDSGWEDNNIFQSGAESSSPARPSPVRKPRPSRPSRKSMSAPPQFSPPSSPGSARALDRKDVVFPQTKFDPQLSPIVKRETNLMSPKFIDPDFFVNKRQDMPQTLELKNEEVDQLNLVNEPVKEELDSGIDREDWEDEQDIEKRQVVAIQSRLSGEGHPVRPLLVERSEPRSSWLFRLLTWVVFALFAAAVIDYKQESAQIGYCNTGSNTNEALQELRIKRSAIEECNRENRTMLFPDNNVRGVESVPCPPPSLNPLPRPDSCTPCPEHADCRQQNVTCANGYLLRSPFPLFFLPAVPSPSSVRISTSSSPAELIWKAISLCLDGLPGFGSVALSPTCKEDPKRKRNINALGKAIEVLLAQERGRRVCSGEYSEKEKDSLPDLEGGHAKQWGIEVSELRNKMQAKTAPQLLPTFDDTFNEAIQQLVEWGGVLMNEDKNGKRYLAHTKADLTLQCALTVKFRETWLELRAIVYTIVVLILSVWTVRVRRAKRLIESKRVAELVQIALDTLRNQEMAYHTDPVSATEPYLSSLQLRDLILQDDHSIANRKRIWDQVERIVEGNANVRVNLEEVEGGDELRVWRWVGSAGRRSIISPGGSAL